MPRTTEEILKKLNAPNVASIGLTLTGNRDGASTYGAQFGKWDDDVFGYLELPALVISLEKEEYERLKLEGAPLAGAGAQSR